MKTATAATPAVAPNNNSIMDDSTPSEHQDQGCSPWLCMENSPLTACFCGHDTSEDVVIVSNSNSSLNEEEEEEEDPRNVMDIANFLGDIEVSLDEYEEQQQDEKDSVDLKFEERIKIARQLQNQRYRKQLRIHQEKMAAKAKEARRLERLKYAQEQTKKQQEQEAAVTSLSRSDVQDSATQDQTSLEEPNIEDSKAIIGGEVAQVVQYESKERMELDEQNGMPDASRPAAKPHNESEQATKPMDDSEALEHNDKQKSNEKDAREEQEQQLADTKRQQEAEEKARKAAEAKEARRLAREKAAAEEERMKRARELQRKRYQEQHQEKIRKTTEASKEARRLAAQEKREQLKREAEESKAKRRAEQQAESQRLQQQKDITRENRAAWHAHQNASSAAQREQWQKEWQARHKAHQPQQASNASYAHSHVPEQQMHQTYHSSPQQQQRSMTSPPPMNSWHPSGTSAVPSPSVPPKQYHQPQGQPQTAAPHRNAPCQWQGTNGSTTTPMSPPRQHPPLPATKPSTPPRAPPTPPRPSSDSTKHTLPCSPKLESEKYQQEKLTSIKNEVLMSWALAPPNFQTLQSIQVLVTSIRTVFPTNHEYFAKWAPITTVSSEAQLKKAVRKIRVFLHPDKLPKDLDEEQLFLCKMLWDVTSDAWEEHTKAKEDLDWV